jgi:hypothetical protein
MQAWSHPGGGFWAREGVLPQYSMDELLHDHG